MDGCRVRICCGHKTPEGHLSSAAAGRENIANSPVAVMTSSAPYSECDNTGHPPTAPPVEHSLADPLQCEHDAENSATDEKEHSREYPSNIQRALILGPVTLTYFLWFLDLAVVSTATPAITTQFNSLVDVGWYALEENLR